MNALGNILFLGVAVSLLILFLWGRSDSSKTEQAETEILAQNWMQWGGPDRNFSLSGELGKFSPKLRWRKDVGAGHSGIVVDDQSVFVCSKKDDKEVVEKVKVADGKALWAKAYSVNYIATNKKYDGPHSTPVLNRSSLFHVSIDGIVRSFDKANGRSQWSVDLKTTGMQLPQSGYGASPIISNQNLILPTLGNAAPSETEYYSTERDQGKTPGAVALDCKTGRIRWRSKPFRSSHASPIEIKVEDQKCVVFHGMFELIGVDPADGRILWRYLLRKIAADNVSFTPVWDSARQQILVSHGYCDLGTQAIVISRSNGQWIPKKSWTNKNLKIVHTNAVIVEDLFVGTNRSPSTSLVNINLTTGKTVTRKRGTQKANLVSIGNQIIFLEENGQLSVLSNGHDRSASYQALSGTCWTAPTISSNHVFIRNQEELKVFSLSGGNQ